MEKLKRLSLTLPASLHKRFKLRCVETDVLMTEFLIGLLARELDRPDRSKAAKTVRDEARA